jgi:hypothetical protein
MTRTRNSLFRASIVPASLFALCLSSGRAEAAVCEAEPTDMSVDYGEQITCGIGPAVNDSDFYRFAGTAGGRILAEALHVSGSGFQPIIELIAPNGTVITTNYTIDTVLPQTGTYTARVFENGNNAVGEYAFTVFCSAGCGLTPPPPPPGSDVGCESEPTDMFPYFGTRVTCEVSPALDTDLYRFAANAGDRVLAEAVWLSGAGFQPIVRLIAPDGALLTTDYTIDMQLPQTGIYTALVFENGYNATGTYAFTVSCTAGKCLSPLASPSVSFTLTGCSTLCQVGDLFTVSAHWRNPGATPVKAELKIGFRSPNGTTTNSLGNKHYEFTFPAGFNVTANLMSIPWPAGQPAGQWSIEAVLLAPDLGETYAREVDFFTVAP